METKSQERSRVLIVDDQKNWREALHDMLESAYEIETAASYDEALQQLQRRTYHVLVADQRLVDSEANNIQGILLIDRVAELQDGTQTIIVTGYPTIAAARAALRGRGAYDYMLKYPEEGGPFKIREYREGVREAAKKAMLERRKLTDQPISLSEVVADITYDHIATTLFPRNSMVDGSREDVEKVITRLLDPFRPLAYSTGKAWLSVANRVCNILCWSRGYGKAAYISIATKQLSPNASQPEWLRANWRLVKQDEFTSVPLIGTSYTIDGTTFEDMASLIGE